MKSCKSVWIVCVLFSLSSHALAQVAVFNATLDGAQQVPSVASSGTGSATLQLNTSTFAWSLSGSFSGLTGTTIDAHIHGPAPAGANAGVLFNLSFTSGATSGSLSGSGTFTPSQATELTSGLYYVNIHTSAFGGGEIRGQLTAVPEPSTYALGAGIGALLAAGIWRRNRRAGRSAAT